MKNPIAVAAGAILAFGAVAVVGIYAVTWERPAGLPGAPDPAAPPQPAAVPEAPAPTAAADAVRRLMAERAAPAAAVPVVMAPPPPKPPPDSWEAVPAVARPAALGPLGGALGRGLNELQPKVSACFDEYTQAGHGTAGYTAVKDYAPAEDLGFTVLMLEVEASRGQLHIVDAPVEARGTASDGLIACAQRVLRGQTMPAPQAQGGGRYRVRYQRVQ